MGEKGGVTRCNKGRMYQDKQETRHDKSNPHKLEGSKFEFGGVKCKT
jgi:hypothetical protein